MHPEDVGRILPPVFLSPSIVILAGRQPDDLTARHLIRSIDLPMDWAAQDRLIGI